MRMVLHTILVVPLSFSIRAPCSKLFRRDVLMR